MKNLTLNIVIVFFFAGILSANADRPEGTEKKSDFHQLSIEIPEHASLNLYSIDKDLEFEADIPETAGEKITFEQTSGGDIWLNYSSVVALGSTNMITAKISELPLGASVKLSVSGLAQEGAKGQTGTGLDVILEESDNPVVTGIGSCFTGTENMGHKLTYSIEADESAYGQMIAKEYDITVTYTIKDE